MAEVDANGFVTVWASTQGQFTAELMIGRMLGLPLSQMKVVPLEVGGAFGGKIVIHGEATGGAPGAEVRPACEGSLLTREEVLQGGSGPAAGALIDVAGRRRSRRPPYRASRAPTAWMPAACRG